MSAILDPLILSIVSEFSAFRFVGIWDHDITADQIIFDKGAAALMTGNSDLSGYPISLSQAVCCVHSDDLVWLLPKIASISQESGRFIADYRINSDSGVRRVLDHGIISMRPDGNLHGLGLIIDITDASCAHFDSNVTGSTPPEIGLFSALSDLQTHMGRSSHRSTVLLDMLRIEIKRSSLQA